MAILLLRQNKRALLAALCLLLTCSFIWRYPRNHKLQIPYTINHDPVNTRRSLHLLVPADKGDFELCRLMLATSILGYPTPHLINWGMKFNGGENQLAGGTHLGKVTGVLKWLWLLEEHQMEDLVVVVDAYDVTFQLPPEVLINQYYRVNREWVSRVSQRPGMKDVISKHKIYQSVLFSADKRCSPQFEHEPWCYLQPLSPLPPDLYGDRTDDPTTGWGKDKLQAMRGRWLNSGLVMGPAHDMIAIFTRAFQQMDRQRVGSDQSLFNFVFAEQEFMREHWRQQALNPSNSIDIRASLWNQYPGRVDKRDAFDDLSPEQKIVNIIDPSSKHHAQLQYVFDLNNTDYHIGLDYFSQLSKATVSAGHEVRLLTYNTTPPTGNLTRDERDCQASNPVLLEDLQQIPAPFPDDFSAPGHPPHPQTWADCPLWTDMCSRQIPVSIHHNGHKLNREMQWTEMWYHRYGKAWLAYRQEEARVAEASALENGAPIPDINDARAWADGRKIGMEEVCANDLNMVFHGCMLGHGWDCTDEEPQEHYRRAS